MSVLPSLENKATYVHDMFARIAPTYDLVNRLMTWGMDVSWRKHVVDAVVPLVQGRSLDIGTGTGDFLPLLAAWSPHGMVVGADACVPMIRQGKKRHQHNPVLSLMGADALHLPFVDESFDVVTSGFVIRNVTDITAAFREMWRVTRVGGMVACLEVSQPHNPLVRVANRAYFSYVVPLIGGVVSGNTRAYMYLNQSAHAFPPADEVATMMREAGWAHVAYHMMSMGAVAIHTGVKL
jgi:demethylmenaquinone methyltransferase/2-methoxy-6-polyprenyl-1,4-benzoquinol methylase